MTARIVVVCVVVAMLAGCATTPPLPDGSAEVQAQAEQDDARIAQTNQKWLAKYASDKAQYLKQVGPNYPYANAVQKGVIVIGMTEAAVDAAGYDCETKEQSTIGEVDACTNMVEAFSSVGANPAPHYVGFDSNGYVVSVQNP